MVRFLQLLALFFLIRWLWRSLMQWLGGPQAKQVWHRASGGAPIYRGRMVRDPACGVYVPQERAVEDRGSGEVRYFCSDRCREAFGKGEVPLKGAEQRP
ncbi:MAG: hypothetical protein ACE5JI_01260 [Acidobacteriota bacterium]